MLAPIVKKLNRSNSVLIEQTIPVDGEIGVHVGEDLRPFDRVGECVFSHRSQVFPVGFIPSKDLITKLIPSVSEGHSSLNKVFAYFGNVLGRIGRQKIIAPYNGNLAVTVGGQYVFQEVESKFSLLSGVWGTIEQVIDKKSVLIRTQTQDLLFAACSPISVSGELIVFPNPGDLLEDDFLEKYVKAPEGKVIYTGDKLDREMVKKASKSGVAALFAGSCSRDVFSYAKTLHMPIGVLGGFGVINTPANIFKFLNQVSHRYVFFQGERNLLRFPIPLVAESTQNLPVKELVLSTTAKKSTKPVYSSLQEVVTGLTVMSTQHPYFGLIGIIDTVHESSIFVRFASEKVAVEILYPNFLIYDIV